MNSRAAGVVRSLLHVRVSELLTPDLLTFVATLHNPLKSRQMRRSGARFALGVEFAGSE